MASGKRVRPDECKEGQARSCSVLFAFAASADDFKTIDGKEHKSATVSRVEPDGIVLSSKSGISKVYFTELPKEVQERFHYDPEKGAAYSAEQNAAAELLRKQQEEAQRQAAEATEKKNKYAGEQLSASEAARRQLERFSDCRLATKNLTNKRST